MAGIKKMVNLKNPHYGGFWIRYVASLLDGLIISMPVNIIAFVISITGATLISYVVVLASIMLVIYLEGNKGGTPGKLILGLRIVNQQGNYIGIPRAILRYIAKILSAIIMGIGFLMIAFTEKKQGLHDKIAKTFVVKVVKT